MSRIFVGNLPMDVKEREIEDIFYKYGKVRSIDLKTPARPPAFAFVTFEDSRDADDAVYGRHGYEFDGAKLRVEHCKERGRDRDRDRGRDRDRDYDRRDRDRNDRGRGGGGRRSEFRVNISGLPRSASWQDLKDFMRKAGDVIYADVDHRGDGVVEFSNEDDMENAIKKLDDTEFANPFDKCFVRVRAAKGDSRGKSRSPSRERSRKSRSPSRERSRKSRSPSRERSHKSRSPSRERSRKSRSPSRERSRKSRSHSSSRGKSRSPSPKRSVSADRDNHRNDENGSPK